MGAKELKRHLRQILWKKGPQMVADLRHPPGVWGPRTGLGESVNP